MCRTNISKADMKTEGVKEPTVNASRNNDDDTENHTKAFDGMFITSFLSQISALTVRRPKVRERCSFGSRCRHDRRRSRFTLSYTAYVGNRYWFLYHWQWRKYPVYISISVHQFVPISNSILGLSRRKGLGAGVSRLGHHSIWYSAQSQSGTV